MKNKLTHIFKELDNVISTTEVPVHESAAGGKTGLALYNFYAGKVLEEESKLEKGGALLESIFDNLSTGKTTLIGHSLASGISGLCIALSILVEDGLIDLDLEANLGSFDNYLIQKSMAELAERKVDFLHQSLGVVYYYTLRQPNEENYKILSSYVDQIIGAAVRDDKGARFLNSSGPRAGVSYDLSIAHGLSGILLILFRIYDLGIKREEIKSFILDSIKYILKFYIPNPNPKKDQSLFALGADLDNDTPQYSNMLAWCYGDLNQLILLIKASQTFETNAWDDIIENVIQRVCSRSLSDSLVHDSHFCHGASGVFFLFDYLNKMLPRAEFQEAKNRWRQTLIDSLDTDLKKNTFKKKETELLEGLVGVGLVLLSEISNQPLAWPKILLM